MSFSLVTFFSDFNTVKMKPDAEVKWMMNRTEVANATPNSVPLEAIMASPASFSFLGNSKITTY